MNKRMISLALAIVMMFGTMSIAFAATGNSKVDWLIEKGLVTGDEGGYRLDDSIRRSEVAAMVVRALDKESTATLLQAVSSRFSDMNSSNINWARGYVNYVASEGIVNGYPNGTFGPYRDITYAEVIKILVMVNGDIPDTRGFDGSAWAIPYITKATSVGITEGVTIPNNDYNAIASREKVFELVYNTIMLREGKVQELYKAIVTGNSRVEDLDGDELNVLVLSRASNQLGSPRFDEGSEIKVTIPANLDSEMLLGKVIDLTIDKDNNGVKATVDNSYTYYNGPIKASDDEIIIDGEAYDVIMGNREDRIYGVYFNDEEYDYDDYVEDLGVYNSSTRSYELEVEFAKVTLLDDSTLFIDSFKFDDIGPVKNVEESGEEVYIYDDKISAREIELNLDHVFGYDSNGFKTMDLDDIKISDVVHVYDKDKAIVRQDAKQAGTFDRVLVDSSSHYTRIEGKLQEIRNTDSKRPIYSLDGQSFFTLMAASSTTNLDDLRGEEVSYLIDLNGDLQLISGDIEYSEKLVILEGISTRDFDAIDKSDASSNYKTDSFSRFLFANSTTARRLTDFNRGDLAYLFNEGNMTDTLVKLTSAEDINRDAKLVSKTSRGAFDINLNNSWIRLETGIVDVNSVTNLFIVEVNGSNVSRIEATTLEDIVDTVNEDSNLRAYVITERDFRELNVGNQVVVGNSTSIAHTIVFTDYELDGALLDTKTIELSYRFNSSMDDSIIGKDQDGKSVEYNVANFANIPNLSVGDIVTLSLGDADEVVGLNIRIDRNKEVFEVLDIDRTGSRIRSLVLQDASKVEKTVYVSRDVIVFGSLDEEKIISYDLDEDGDVEVIFVK